LLLGISIFSMNRTMFRFIVLFCLAATGLIAGEKANPKQITKSPDGDPDVPTELLAYYARLLKDDADVKGQVARLTARSRVKAGGLFKQWDEPRVVEWLPFSETRSSEGETLDGHYLIIQLAGRWRTKDSDADTALVSEFQVNYDGSKLTMTFLGFRKLTLTALRS
jgi:hypothetical protein